MPRARLSEVTKARNLEPLSLRSLRYDLQVGRATVLQRNERRETAGQDIFQGNLPYIPPFV